MKQLESFQQPHSKIRYSPFLSLVILFNKEDKILENHVINVLQNYTRNYLG